MLVRSALAQITAPYKPGNGVVQTRADIGFPCAVGREVIVQRQSGRLQFGAACAGAATKRDVVFKRSRNWRFDARIVPNVVLGIDDRADVRIDIGIHSRQSAGVGLDVRIAYTNTKFPIAQRLVKGRGRQCYKNGGKNQSGEFLCSNSIYEYSVFYFVSSIASSTWIRLCRIVEGSKNSNIGAPEIPGKCHNENCWFLCDSRAFGSVDAAAEATSRILGSDLHQVFVLPGLVDEVVKCYKTGSNSHASC